MVRAVVCGMALHVASGADVMAMVTEDPPEEAVKQPVAGVCKAILTKEQQEAAWAFVQEKRTGPLLIAHCENLWDPHVTYSTSPKEKEYGTGFLVFTIAFLRDHEKKATSAQKSWEPNFCSLNNFDLTTVVLNLKNFDLKDVLLRLKKLVETQAMPFKILRRESAVGYGLVPNSWVVYDSETANPPIDFMTLFGRNAEGDLLPEYAKADGEHLVDQKQVESAESVD